MNKISIPIRSSHFYGSDIDTCISGTEREKKSETQNGRT